MNENFYQQLIQESPLGYAGYQIIYDPLGSPCDCQFLEFNPSFERLTGLMGSEVMGKKLSEVLPAWQKNKQNWLTLPGERDLPGDQQGFEAYFAASGKWCRIFIQAPEKGYLIAQLIDVTNVINDLTKERIMLSALNDIVFILDEDYRYRDVIVADDRHLFMPRQAIIGSRIQDIFPESLAAQIIASLQQAFLSGEMESLRYQSVLPDDDRWFEATVKYTESLDKKSYLVGISEITDHKKLEDQLISKTQELENFFSINLDLLCIADLSGNFLKVNKEWEYTLGYTKEELEKRTIWEFVHPDDLEATMEAMAKLDKQERVLNFINRYRCQDGSYRYFEWRSQPHGALIYAAARDITQNKQFEAELSTLKEEYEIVFHGTQDCLHLVNVVDDHTFRYIRNNYAHQMATSISFDHFRGKSPQELLGETVGGQVAAHYQQCVQCKMPINYEEIVQLESGKRVWATTLMPVFREQRVAYIVGSSQDITEQKQAEDELRRHQESLANILEATNVGTWEWNVETGETVFNQRWAEIIGYTLAELAPVSIGTWRHYTHQEDLKAAEIQLERIFARELTYYDIECRMKHKNGSWIWVQNKGKVTAWTADGKPLQMYGTQMDISERKKMEEDLRDSEEKYRLIFKHSPLGLFHFDRQGLITDCNDNLVKIIGSSYAALVGLDMLHVPDKNMAAAVYGALQGEMTFYDDDYKSFTAVKTTPIRGIFEPISAEGQGIVGGVGIIEDITQRRKMETALNNEKKLLETTLISVGDGVISTDEQGNIMFLNRVAEALTGWTQEAAKGKHIEEVFQIIDEFSREKSENIVQKVLRSGRILELANHTLLISKDGLECPIEDSAAPIMLENGMIVGVVLVFRDFSEKKHKQEEILYLSYHDQLTGLYNRRYYEEQLNRLDINRNYPLTIVMADVNGLKLINDSFGHALGDELLKKAAEVIKQGCRAEELVARIGGDEFVMLLPKTDSQEAEKIIKRIEKIMAEEKVGSLDVSISFGYGTKIDTAETIEIAFKNAEDQMYRNKLYDSSSVRSKTITLIMNTLYEKSHREMLHSRRVGEICAAIAAKLNFDKDNINQMRIAGLMHDIGKMGIDEKTLNKAEGLSLDEWKEMKRHPEIGYRILSSSNEFSEIAEYVLAHQERWDGQGYPKGLKGDEISLQARIIAVADAYDAMTSDRAYRKGLTEAEAIAEIRNSAGTQFDPEIVKIYMADQPF